MLQEMRDPGRKHIQRLLNRLMPDRRRIKMNGLKGKLHDRTCGKRTDERSDADGTPEKPSNERRSG